jgi:hypothetical protein
MCGSEDLLEKRIKRAQPMKAFAWDLKNEAVDEGMTMSDALFAAIETDELAGSDLSDN